MLGSQTPAAQKTHSEDLAAQKSAAVDTVQFEADFLHLTAGKGTDRAAGEKRNCIYSQSTQVDSTSNDTDCSKPQGYLHLSEPVFPHCRLKMMCLSFQTDTRLMR